MLSSFFGYNAVMFQYNALYNKYIKASPKAKSKLSQNLNKEQNKKKRIS